MGSLTKHNVGSYISNYNLINYVETGTGLGECLEYAMRHPFEKLNSVEIYDELYEKAKQKFAGLSKVYNRECKIFHGHSADELVSILKDIDKDEPTLFFLDAHFPGADFRYETYDAVEDENVRVPLKSELEVIKKHRDTKNDVFIIDDLWLYEDEEYEAGSLQQHLDKHFPDMGYTQEKLSGGQDIKFVYNLFLESHNIIKDSRDQGYLILTPRK